VTTATAVALLRWPDEAERRAELQRLGIPRLLMVAADTSPPTDVSTDEDWVRLPADDADIRARVALLADTAIARPSIDEFGVLSVGTSWVALSHIDEAIMRSLLDSFRTTVGRDDVRAAAWPDGSRSGRVLDTHMHRLRNRIAPLGLTIHTVRRRGFVLDFTPADADDTDTN
jgi:two-component system OmpR family response regulator